MSAEILAELMTPAGQADPYPLYARAHQAGPVSAVGDGWFMVSGYAAVSQVLRDPGFGLPGPGSDNSLLSRSILARLEAGVAFPRLLALAPAPGQPPVRRSRLILRGYESLPVTVLTSPLGQP